MDEPERDASLGASESTVAVRELAVEENPVDSEVSVSEGQVDDSLTEELGRVEGGDGTCNGEDIMVEVLGSDVYVDGVCTNRIAGDLDEVGRGVSTDSDPSFERDGTSCGGDVRAISESEVGVSGHEANEGVQSTVEGVSGAGESIEKVSQEAVEGCDRAVDAMVRDNDARTDGSSIVSCPMDRETGDIHVVKEDVASKEAMDVEISQLGPDHVDSFHNSPNDKILDTEESQKVEGHPEQIKDSTKDNGFGDDLLHEVGESQLVTDDSLVTDGGEALEEGKVQESVEEGKQFVDVGVDTSADMKSGKLDISDADVWNPEIKTSSCSADGNENSNSWKQDAIEKPPEMISEKNLNPQDISHVDALENVFSNLERDEQSVIETEHGDIGKDEHLDDHSKVAGREECSGDILINRQKITDAEQPILFEGPNSAGVPEVAVQMLSSENLDKKKAVPKDVTSTNSISSSQSNQINAEADVSEANDSTNFTSNMEVLDENEHNLNAQTECRNMESNFQANGLGDVTMGLEKGKNAVNGNASADSENVEEMGVEESNDVNQVCLHGEEEMEDVTDIDNVDDQIVECAALNPESSIKVHRARYQLPAENEGDFSISDLVWGKVRSHPWWPGQIFDPSDSSEKAMKYYKKDFFLVAYFGDRTFAWNEASHLKPFRTNFALEEIQSNSESFQNAVECALEEVSRRSELGLACACTPREAFDMIECQIVENAGIREESSRRYGVDKSASARSFEPAKLIDFIRDLAKFPADGGDRLELVIAKAQLTAFYRLKGYCLPQFHFCGLSQFQFCGGLEDDDLDTPGIEASGFVQHGAPSCPDDAQTLSCQENLKGQSSSYHKRKHNLKDGLYPKKERSLSELMGETYDNIDGENWSDGKTTTSLASPSAKRRKTVDDHTDDSSTPEGRKTSFVKVSNTAPLKQSFKIGDCIRRVASQLTGTPPIVKSNSERFQKPDGGNDGHAGYESDVFFHSFDDAQRARVNFPAEYSSLDELLYQLQLVATDPMNEYEFLSVIASFFADFRESIMLRQHSGIEDLAAEKRKTLFTSIIPSPETFEFEDMSDTYWTDRVIQNGTEVQPSRRNRKREYQLTLAEPEKSPQGSRRPYKKRHSIGNGNHAMTAEKFSGRVDEPSPAELIMNFSEVDSVPSERTLNNMFRRFGPLRESETEVDREGGRARVVFKRSSDAEIAFSSAGRFNIFGPRLVNYQLSHTPSTLFKASSVPRSQDQEMHLDLSSTQFQEMQLDLASFNDHEMHLDLSSIHDQEMQLDLSTLEYQEMDSVLDPNQDQESKPSYMSNQLAEMQADFSTIHYERQPDLALTHDHELHTVFVSNHETNSVPTASQDQELQPNFISTQLGEMPAVHALNHQDEPPVSASTQEQEMQAFHALNHHDEPPVSASTQHALTHHDEPPASVSTQEQEMRSVFLTIKEEKPQPDIASPQEETQSVLATIPEQEMQADLTQVHDNEQQTVPATTQEQEMQPVFAMSHEEKQPVLTTIQEQEKQAVIVDSMHHVDTSQDQEMQPVLETIQANEMLPVLTSSREFVREPIPSVKEGQEAREGHELEHVLAPTEPATHSVPTRTHEQEDTQPFVLTGEETREETQPDPQSTQELEIQPDLSSALELEADQVDNQRHELQPNQVTTEEHEAVSVCPTSQAREFESDHDAGPEQDVLHDNGTNEVTEMQCDDGTNEVPEMQCDDRMNEVPEMQCDDGTNEVCDDGSNEVCDDGTNEVPEMQCDDGTNQEQDLQCDNGTNQEQDLQCDDGTNAEQDLQCDNGTNKEQDLQCDDGSNQEQDMQCGNGRNQEQDMQCGNGRNQEQDMQCGNAPNKEQGSESGNTSHDEQDTQSDHEQEMQADHAFNQEREAQSNFDTLHEQETQSDLAGKHTTQVQVVQSDLATSPDAERHTDFVPTKDQEMQLGH